MLNPITATKPSASANGAFTFRAAIVKPASAKLVTTVSTSPSNHLPNGLAIPLSRASSPSTQSKTK